jgi:hypothetical protein
MRCTDLNGHAFYGVLLRPLACWDCGFESCRGHGCLSLVNVVCHPSRGVLMSVVCLSAMVKAHEEALAHKMISHHRKEKITIICIVVAVNLFIHDEQ